MDTIREIVDRTDIDSHSDIHLDDLGEDWGDGFYVQEEPVLIERDGGGAIRRTTPLSELGGLPTIMDYGEEPLVVSPSYTPTPIPTSEREKLAFILAKRLWDYYRNRPYSPTELNPIHDGIPICRQHPDGCFYSCPPQQQLGKYMATPSEVLYWLQRVIGSRISITNRRQGWGGWKQDLAGVVSINKKSMG